MFKTPKQLGISDVDINKICEELWSDRKELTSCPDCGVEPGETHDDNCDVAYCLNCGEQSLQCDCGDTQNDTWTGIWPGIKECYEQKLICFDDCKLPDGSLIGWRFDLNTWYINK